MGLNVPVSKTAQGLARLINSASRAYEKQPDLAVIAFNFRLIKNNWVETVSGFCRSAALNGLWCSSSTLDDDREGTLMTHTHTHLLNEKKRWGLKMPSFLLSLLLPLIILLHTFQCGRLFFSSTPHFPFHHCYSLKSNSSFCLGDQIKPSYLTICWAGVLDCPAPFKSCSPSVLSKLLRQTSRTLCVV